jgi:dTDP-4-dehydrorhamnose reductase
MRILITGGHGMLGIDTRRAALARGIEVIACSHAELDITDEAAVRAIIGAANVDAVFNLAAYTDVDGAESDGTAAHAVNGTGAGNVAGAAADAGAWTIHVSSDYVFDGAKRSPYLESDATGPLSVYGASKLAGERAVAQAAPDSHTIVRSSWLFGTAGPCFPATMLRLAAERDQLTVVDDQLGCPTFTGHLAAALVSIVTDPQCRRALRGIVHVAAAGECSWYQFAREIISVAGIGTQINPGSTAALGRPAPRPAYSVMRTERGEQVPRLPHWRAGLEDYMSSRVQAT